MLRSTLYGSVDAVDVMEWVVDRVVRCHWPLRDSVQVGLLQRAPRRCVSRHDRDEHGRRTRGHCCIEANGVLAVPQSEEKWLLGTVENRNKPVI